MNKYRIEIKTPHEGLGASTYEAYADSTAHAAMLALSLGHNQAAVGDALAMSVKLLKVNLKRAHAACKRVQ